jgi:hypothetical protein
MFYTILAGGLYIIGLFIGCGLIPFFVFLTPSLEDEEEGIELDKKYDKLFLCAKFVDEVEDAPNSSLTEEELNNLRDKVLDYDIPYLGHKVILFYDHSKEAFCYYANSTIIYKYLNVVARRYVLDYGCKQIYKELIPSIKVEEKTVTFGNFVPRVGKTELTKDVNKFIYLGNMHDIPAKVEDVKKISFSDYMKLTWRSSSSPESQLTKTD